MNDCFCRTKCVYTSEQFPDERFEANFWHITVMRPAGREEGGWPWGIFLMLGGLACMLSMCFGWNKPEPVKSDEEAPMLKQIIIVIMEIIKITSKNKPTLKLYTSYIYCLK